MTHAHYVFHCLSFALFFGGNSPILQTFLFHQHESLNIFKNIWCASPMLGNKVGMLLVLGQFSNRSNTCTSFDDFQYQNCLNLYKIVYQYTHLFLGRLGSSNDTLTRCVFTASLGPCFSEETASFCRHFLFQHHESLNIFKRTFGVQVLCEKTELECSWSVCNHSNTCTSFDDFQYYDCLNLY